MAQRDESEDEPEDTVSDILSKAKPIKNKEVVEESEDENEDEEKASLVERISTGIQSLGVLSEEDEERAKAQRDIDRRILQISNEHTADVWSEKDKEKHASMQKLERGLLRIDRLMLSKGIHLLVLLPSIMILLEIMSWNWRLDSPGWWKDSIEDTLGLSFNFVLSSLALVVSAAWTLGLLITRQRLSITQSIMADEVERFQRMGRPFSSMHGYPALEEMTSGTLRNRTTTATLAIFTFMLLLAGLFSDTTKDGSGILFLFSLGSTMLTLGLHLISREDSYSTVEAGGILSTYEPPVHPALLGQVFSDLMLTHMDPFLRMRFEDFMQRFRAALQPGFDPVIGRERLFYILHLHRRGSLSNEERYREVAEIILEDEMEEILNHPFFNDEVWAQLLDRIGSRCPSFFRILDRLEHSLRIDIKSLKKDKLIFDVDMENVVYKQANLFCLLINNSQEDRSVVLRIESPDFRPGYIHLNLNLPAAGGMISSMPDHMDLSSEGDDDVLAAIANLLNVGQLNWQTLLPERLGEATVSISLEDENGDLILGRVINLRVRSEWNQRLAKLTGLISLASGVVSIFSSLILQVLSVIRT
jgi:hypothetical protein